MREVPDCLSISVTLRIPVVDPEATFAARISELESYLLLAAFTQGDLAAARLQAHVDLRRAQHEWDHLQGWEALRGRARTNASVEDAKRQLRPGLYDEIEDAKWVVKRLSEEYDRLQSDADRCSRVLTPARLDALIPQGAFVD